MCGIDAYTTCRVQRGMDAIREYVWDLYRRSDAQLWKYVDIRNHFDAYIADGFRMTGNDIFSDIQSYLSRNKNAYATIVNKLPIPNDTGWIEKSDRRHTYQRRMYRGYALEIDRCDHSQDTYRWSSGSAKGITYKLTVQAAGCNGYRGEPPAKGARIERFKRELEAWADSHPIVQERIACHEAR